MNLKFKKFKVLKMEGFQNSKNSKILKKKLWKNSMIKKNPNVLTLNKLYINDSKTLKI